MSPPESAVSLSQGSRFRSATRGASIPAQNLVRWKESRKSFALKAKENGRRLQSMQRKKGFDPSLAEYYSLPQLRNYIHMERAVSAGLVFVAIVSIMSVASSMVYFIPAVVAIWLASISYRLYRHHLKCFWYIRSLQVHSSGGGKPAGLASKEATTIGIR